LPKLAVIFKSGVCGALTIVRHYQPQIEEFMRQSRSTPFDSNSCVDKYGESEPF
jgi:hypothetical protein